MYVASTQVTLLNCDCWDRQHPSTYSAASLLLFLDAKANSAPIMPANRIKANTSTDTTEMVRTIYTSRKYRMSGNKVTFEIMQFRMQLVLKDCYAYAYHL